MEPSSSDARVVLRRAGTGDPSATRWTRRARDRDFLPNTPEGDESEDIDEDGNLINLGILSEHEQEDLLDANMHANEQAEINRAILLSLRDEQRPLQDSTNFYSLPAEHTAVAAATTEASGGAGAAAGGAVEGPREEDIQSLEAMGFSRGRVVAALTAKSNNIELAADHLLNGGEG